ncbi:MAG: hypothetical protein CL583_05195 [Alteromonadaceae bacterium]|nr:hypothetical protein [Alteromonadaceae bacterium]|tara:strand:- start:1329 stop:2306 length:978 start_codon:yes stop_codon:yes gene_type:complete
MKRFSIIVPAYNAEAHITETVHSIKSAMGRDDEIIIVDDASQDGTKACVTEILGPQGRYVRLSKNSGGPAKPRNEGIKIAQGQYIALFDADDVMLSNKLKRTAEIFEENPNIGLVFTNFRTIGRTDGTTCDDFLGQYDFIKTLRSRSRNSFYIINKTEATQQLAKANYIGTSGVVVPRKILEDYGYFDETLPNGDDYEMWLRISRRVSIGYIDEVLHAYRVGGSSISAGGALKLSPAKIRVLERQLLDPLDEEFKRDISYWLAQNYKALSREYLHKGDMKAARISALNAFRHRIDGASVKYFSLSLLGAFAVKGIIRSKKKYFPR